MKYIYIKSIPLENKPVKSVDVLYKTLSFFIPPLNPGLEKELKNVYAWVIEFDCGGATANREVALSKDGAAVVKMPSEKNYGYWTDSQLTLGYFAAHFDVEFINKEYFEMKWNELDGS
jgi:hypothetical protein